MTHPHDYPKNVKTNFRTVPDDVKQKIDPDLLNAAVVIAGLFHHVGAIDEGLRVFDCMARILHDDTCQHMSFRHHVNSDDGELIMIMAAFSDRIKDLETPMLAQILAKGDKIRADATAAN